MGGAGGAGWRSHRGGGAGRRTRPCAPPCYLVMTRAEAPAPGKGAVWAGDTPWRSAAPTPRPRQLSAWLFQRSMKSLAWLPPVATSQDEAAALSPIDRWPRRAARKSRRVRGLPSPREGRLSPAPLFPPRPGAASDRGGPFGRPGRRRPPLFRRVLRVIGVEGEAYTKRVAACQDHVCGGVPLDCAGRSWWELRPMNRPRGVLACAAAAASRSADRQ
jgi:hypothetical protein